MKQKITYYENENTDFFHLESEKVIDGSYKYDRRGFFGRILYFICYRMLATPAAYIYTKIRFREKFIGKRALRAYKKQGYIIVANHTQPIADAFSPNVLTFPKQNSLIINKDNLSLPVLGKTLPYLGGIPLPDDIKATRNFLTSIKTRLDRGEAITVYPEAHVWPFYTGIRPFRKECFDIPVRFGVPVFTATRIYKKSRIGYRCLIYIDGPFQPDTEIPKRDAIGALADTVSDFMKSRAALSDIEVIKYIKKDSDTQANPPADDANASL